MKREEHTNCKGRNRVLLDASKGGHDFVGDKVVFVEREGCNIKVIEETLR
jgi:hypothetical protein